MLKMEGPGDQKSPRHQEQWQNWVYVCSPQPVLFSPALKQSFSSPMERTLSQKRGESFGFVLHWENCTGKAWPGLTETTRLMNSWVAAAPFQDGWLLWELAGFTELPFWVRKIISLEWPLWCWWGLSNRLSCPKRLLGASLAWNKGEECDPVTVQGITLFWTTLWMKQ